MISMTTPAALREFGRITKDPLTADLMNALAAFVEARPPEDQAPLIKDVLEALMFRGAADQAALDALDPDVDES